MHQNIHFSFQKTSNKQKKKQKSKKVKETKEEKILSPENRLKKKLRPPG